ncbi:4779_t:CDS:1, partial [Cetraspora pellucida]
MSFFVNQVLDIALTDYGEQIIDLTSSDTIASQSTELENEPLTNASSLTTTSRAISPWSISMKMQEIINEFEDTILHQFPCIHCSICSKLMYPEKAMWIPRDPNFQYPFIATYPSESLFVNPNPPANRIAI